MLKSDLRFVFRSLWRRPGFALAAILTIALGVGANSAVFSVIYSVLLRPLPIPQPDSLVQLWQTDPSLGETQISFMDFRDWRNWTKSFQQLSAYTFQTMNRLTLMGQGEPEQIQGTMVSYDLFPMLGIRMLKGRSFTSSEEDRESRVVLLSEQLWKQKFRADPNIVGRAIQVGPLSFTVVGVVPQKQALPQWADVWMPLSLA